MKEINVENELELEILINDEPDVNLIIADEDSGFLKALELQISDYFNKWPYNFLFELFVLKLSIGIFEPSWKVMSGIGKWLISLFTTA